MKKASNLLRPGLFGNGVAAADTRRSVFDMQNEVLFVHETPIDVLFIGDSITEMWAVDAYFKDFGILVNRGIGGDIAEHIDLRFEADCLQLKPSLCVCMMGVNNTWILSLPQANHAETEKRIAETVMAAYERMFEKCRAHSQRMLVCAILPHDRPVLPCNDDMKRLIKEMNSQLEELCQKNNIPFLNWHGALAKEDGLSTAEGLMDDGLHPNTSGYDIMAGLLYPKLKELL